MYFYLLTSHVFLLIFSFCFLILFLLLLLCDFPLHLVHFAAAREILWNFISEKSLGPQKVDSHFTLGQSDNYFCINEYRAKFFNFGCLLVACCHQLLGTGFLFLFYFHATLPPISSATPLSTPRFNVYQHLIG